MAVKTLVSGGINWNWYLQADFNETDKTVHVYFYDRWHKHEGPAHPKWESVGQWDCMEGNKRNLYGIKINKIEYLVTNPGYIFGYNDFTHLVTE